MKINFDFVVKNLSGESFKQPDPLNAQQEIDLKAYDLIPPLLITPSFKQGEYFKKFLLSERIFKEKDIEITDEEYSLITAALRLRAQTETKNPLNDSYMAIGIGYILKQLNQLKSTSVKNA